MLMQCCPFVLLYPKQSLHGIKHFHNMQQGQCGQQ